MKKFWKYLAAAAVIMSVTPLMSCDDDDDYSSSPGRPDYSKNRVYMLDPESDFATIAYKVSGEFINSLENPLTLTQIRCTRPAPEDVTVIAEIDPTLVDEYNQANGTDCAFMQGAKLVNTTYTIPRGEFLATEKLAVDLTDHSALVGSEKNLILPIAIKHVTGGLVISKTSRFFIVFDYQANELTIDTNNYIDVDVSESGWQSAYTNYVIKDFITSEWAAENAVTVNATVDNTLITSYNAANGTNYKELSVTVQPVTLAKDATSADLSIRLSNYTGVDNGETYLVPLSLSIASGAGAALSSDVVYVVVRKMPVKLEYVSNSKPASWTKIQYQDNWVATLNGQTEDEDGSLTAFITTGWGAYVDNGDVLQADLGAPTTIGGMSLEFYAWYYAAKNIYDVAISNDGSNWIPVQGGDWSGGASVPHLKFNKPQTFRYIRFTFGQPYYASYGSLFELASFYTI